MTHFRAYFEHRRGDDVTTTDIIYEAEDLRDALDSAKRFYNGRQVNVPEWFGELLAVKVHQYTVGRIDEKGSLEGGLSFMNFEWKIDMGWTWEQRVDMATRKRT